MGANGRQAKRAGGGKGRQGGEMQATLQAGVRGGEGGEDAGSAMSRGEAGGELLMEEELGGFGSGGRSARAHLPGAGPQWSGRFRVRAHELVGRGGREGPPSRCAPRRTPTSSRLMVAKVAIFFP